VLAITKVGPRCVGHHKKPLFKTFRRFAGVEVGRFICIFCDGGHSREYLNPTRHNNQQDFT
jgi:hypothetical protein